MKYLLAFLGLLGMVGCGQGTVNAPQDHGGFEPYFQAFEAESLAHGRATAGDAGISIEFGTVSVDGTDGQCNNSLNQFGVTIDQNQWFQLTEDQKTILIAHELGHCLLNRVHVASVHEDLSSGQLVVPDSIMYPKLLISFNGEEKAYWDELFH